MRPDRRAIAVALVAALALSACGGGEDPPAPASTEEAVAAPTEAPPAEAPPEGPSDGSSPAINSITADPANGTLLIGTGPALYRVAPGEREAEKLTGRLSTPQGEGTVSGNLVVRFAGPGALVASGHPMTGGLPENLGLIGSSDHGDSWESIAGLGEADYHEIEVVDALTVAVEAESPDIQVSRDGGRSWEARPPPAAPIDVVIDPGDPQRWAVSSEQGTFVSNDGGGSWRSHDTTFGARLIWPSTKALYSIDRNGRVRVSPDGGGSWEDRGEVGGLPSAVTSGRNDELLAGVIGGKVRRSRDGGATWATVATLR